jgi:hypothetical protein
MLILKKMTLLLAHKRSGEALVQKYITPLDEITATRDITTVICIAFRSGGFSR